MPPDDTPTDRKPLQGNAPYGFAWQNNTLVHHPIEAPVRKMMFELLVQSGRKKAVARSLNDVGHRTRDGSRWSDTTIDRMIRDPLAKGVRGAEAEGGLQTVLQTANTSDHQRIWQVPPIVSEALWEQCNGLLATSELGRRRGRQAIHLFAGVLVCHCGRRMYVRTHSTNYSCSACANRIASEDLEAILIGQLANHCLSPNAARLGLQNLLKQWPALEYGEKRRLIENLTEKIVAGTDEIGITLCELPALDTSPPNETFVSDANTGAGDRRPANSREEASETPAQRQKIDPVTLAVALMKDHPEWSARKLAQATGCSHTTLTRSPLFRTAKALFNDKRQRSSGWRDTDGRVEAMAEDEGD